MSREMFPPRDTLSAGPLKWPPCVWCWRSRHLKIKWDIFLPLKFNILFTIEIKRVDNLWSNMSLPVLNISPFKILCSRTRPTQGELLEYQQKSLVHRLAFRHPTYRIPWVSNKKNHHVLILIWTFKLSPFLVNVGSYSASIGAKTKKNVRTNVHIRVLLFKHEDLGW